jgi:hypothetical protein
MLLGETAGEPGTPSIHSGGPVELTALNVSISLRHLVTTCGNGSLSAVLVASIEGGAPPFNYTWNAGDGSGPSYASSLTHTYASAGEFAVRLHVADATGATANGNYSLQLNRPICPPSSPSPTSPAPGLSLDPDIAAILGVLALSVAVLLELRRRRRRRVGVNQIPES